MPRGFMKNLKERGAVDAKKEPADRRWAVAIDLKRRDLRPSRIPNKRFVFS